MPNVTLQNSDHAAPLVRAYVGPSARLVAALPSSAPALPNQVVLALIDTGAERTLVAGTALQRIGLSPTGTISIRSMTTGTTPALRETFDVSLGLVSPTTLPLFDNLEVVEGAFTTSGVELLIGRDVLSRLILIYNGPQNQFTLAF